MYTVTIDREACDGVFACLVRDDRFREDEEGLAGLDVDDVERTTERVRATLSADRESAEQAAAACPVDAIAVADGDVQSRDCEGTEAGR